MYVEFEKSQKHLRYVVKINVLDESEPASCCAELKEKRVGRLPSTNKAPEREGSFPPSWQPGPNGQSVDRPDLLLQMGKLLQVSEPLLLVHAGMQGQRHNVQDFEEPGEALDAGDTVGKH